MKRILAAFIAFLAMAGVGCATLSLRSVSLELPTQPTTESVVDAIGVVAEIDVAARHFLLVLPDGTAEDVTSDNNEAVTNLRVGMLVKVTGERDLSTRFIRASDLRLAQDSGLRISSPTTGATVTSPLVVFGFAKTVTGQIGWRVRDFSGIVQASGRAPVQGDANVFAPFRLDVFLPVLPTVDFTLEVTIPDARGTDTAVAALPLKLLEKASTSLTLLFPNTLQGSGHGCNIVFPTTHVIAKTSAVARAAALELLKGTNESDRSKGYTTWIPTATTLRSVSVSEEVVTVDFSKEINQAAVGCRTDGVKAQIAQTFLQIPGIRTVLVNVEGQPSSRFQP